MKQKRMSRAMERLKKKREKDKENEPNKKDTLFKSARIKNLVNILEGQMGEKGIVLGKEKNDEEKINKDIIEENTVNDNNEVKVINKKKISKKEFDE